METTKWDLIEVKAEGYQLVELIQKDAYSTHITAFEIEDFCSWVDWLVEKRKEIVSQGKLAN